MRSDRVQVSEGIGSDYIRRLKEPVSFRLVSVSSNLVIPLSHPATFPLVV